MPTTVPPAPLSPAEVAIVARVVDTAPPLRPTAVAELSALFGGAA